jgi:hypothetical protein
LQALSGAVPHFGATQGRDHVTQGQGNCSQPAYPSTSQQLFATQPLHSQTRSHATQRNIPPTGGAYASPQSPQHSNYPQQTSQRVGMPIPYAYIQWVCLCLLFVHEMS